MNEILDQLKINSNVPLIESTDSSDIELSDKLIGRLIQDKYNTSLAYQISDVQALTGPYGQVFTSRRSPDTSDFEIIKKEVQTQTNLIDTGFTQEVIQDLKHLYNASAKNVAMNVIKGLSDQEENRTLLTKLFQESEVKPALTVQDSHMFESVIFQISQKVSQSVIEMNRDSYKTLDSFCILPKDFAAAVLGSFNYMSEGKERSLFVGRIGRTDYYINPFPNTTSQFTDDFSIDYESEDSSIPNYAYVGLKTKQDGKASLIFCPYLYESEYITDPDTGEAKLFVRNRYGLVTSPLHQPLENKSLLHKFELIKA